MTEPFERQAGLQRLWRTAMSAAFRPGRPARKRALLRPNYSPSPESPELQLRQPPSPSVCTVFPPFRGPKIGANHTYANCQFALSWVSVYYVSKPVDKIRLHAV